jgi:molecular chaperone DnaJ
MKIKQNREQHRVRMECVMPLGVFVFHDCSIYRSDVRVNKKEAPVDAVRLWLVQPSGRNGFVERVKFTHWPVPKLDAVRHQSVQCLGVVGGFDFSGFNSDDLGGIQFDFGDIFSNIFGGGGRSGSNRPKRGRDISVDIEIPFADAVFGTERTVLINKVGQCEECKGSGAKVGTTLTKCTTCAGKGKIQETRQSFIGVINTWQECPTCHGRGEIPEKPCAVCRGAGVLKRGEEIKLTIPASIESGEMIRLSGRGEAVSVGVPGDLYVRVHVLLRVQCRG